MLQILVEDLERHTVTCEHNCGGFTGSTVARVSSSRGSTNSTRATGRRATRQSSTDTPWVYNKDWAPGWCPDWDPGCSHRADSACQTVLIILERGMVWDHSTETCDAAGIDVVTPRTAYYTLGALALGGRTVQSGGSQLDAYSGYPHCASSILSMRNGDC